MNKTSRLEQLLGKWERVAKKAGKLATALSWMDKVYKNEMVKEIAKKIWSML